MSAHVALKMRVMAAIAEEPSLSRRGVRRLRLLAAGAAALGAAVTSWTGLRLVPLRLLVGQVLPAFAAAFAGALIAGFLMDARRWMPRRSGSPPEQRETSARLH
jgi:hypothetical protein